MGDSGDAPAASQVQGNAPAGSAAAGSSMDSATFNQLDRDKDGFITREEAPPSELGAGAASGGSSTGEYGSGPGNRYDSND